MVHMRHPCARGVLVLLVLGLLSAKGHAFTLKVSSLITPAQAQRAARAAHWLFQRVPPQKRTQLLGSSTSLLAGASWLQSAGIVTSRRLGLFRKELRRAGYERAIVVPASQWSREWAHVWMAYKALSLGLSRRSLKALEGIDAVLEGLPQTSLVKRHRSQLQWMMSLCLVPSQNIRAVRPLFARMRSWLHKRSQ